MGQDLMATLGLVGWSSTLVWISLICLLVWILGDGIISKYWKEDPEYARRVRSIQRGFGLMGKTALVFYGFFLWASGIAGENIFPALLGLSLICLVTFQSAFTPSCFTSVTLAWFLFVVYVIALGYIVRALAL